jgi:hypothetical protein
MRALVLGFAMFIAALPVHAAPPGAPSLTAGPGFKSLQFDWEPEAGATWYELWYKPSASGAWRQLSPDLSASTTTFERKVSAHLFNWWEAQYRLAACNADGCTNSAAVSVEAHRLDSVGYFKASRSEWYARFGESVDLNSGGSNFVAAAPDDAEGFVTGIATAYVFRRPLNGAWYQRSRLRPLPDAPGHSQGMKVSISGNGNTVVIGLPAQPRASGANLGRVFVYKNTAGVWSRTELPTIAGTAVGRWVSINDQGTSIAVGGASAMGAYRLLNGAWTRVRHIKRAGTATVCPNGLITSADIYVVETCYDGPASAPTRQYLLVHQNQHTNWSSAQEVDLGPSTGTRPGSFAFALTADGSGRYLAVQTFDTELNVRVLRNDGGSFVQKARFVNPALAFSYDDFGRSLALSADGRYLAIGNPAGRAGGTGVQRPPLDLEEQTSEAGNVFLYRAAGTEVTDTQWTLASVAKANYQWSFDASDVRQFGFDVALDATGETLLIGHPGESSGASGIGGNWANAGAEDVGAVWLY